MKIDVEDYTDNPPPNEWELLCTWTLDEKGRAVCDQPALQEAFDDTGLMATGEPWVFPKEGARFLRALQKHHNRSSRSRAIVRE